MLTMLILVVVAVVVLRAFHCPEATVRQQWASDPIFLIKMYGEKAYVSGEAKRDMLRRAHELRKAGR